MRHVLATNTFTRYNFIIFKPAMIIVMGIPTLHSAVPQVFYSMIGTVTKNMPM
jgi:hypothetical protein